ARLGGGDPTRIGLTYVALVVSTALVLPCALPFIAPDASVRATKLVVALGAQLLPLALGLWLRVRDRRQALLLAPRLRSAGTLLLVAVIVLLVVTRGARLPTLGVRTNVALILVVGASLAAGAALGRGRACPTPCSLAFGT
ncbi:MAG TPA: hypothetical protein VFZ61_00720, partial [Polyangiales bacterium]